jgi:peptidoglycan/LPS O-acetylase OafA/YrhL
MIGNVSYSLYLVHLFVMRLVTLAFRHFAGPLGVAYPIIYFVVFVIAAVGAAFASYRFLERPAERACFNGLQALLRIRPMRLGLDKPGASAATEKPAARGD